MSEVSDAVQVVMLCGRGAMLVGNISLKLALQIAKLFNTLYLAKWKGSVSFNRLRQTKGDDLIFINVSSEKAEDLAAVEKEMKAHGILYARMPDLCGGDARTQYAISTSDAVKMKAMLLDHASGPNSRVRVGPISEKDYMMTGIRPDGSATKEMDDLERSAREQAEADGRKTRERSNKREAPGNEREKETAAGRRAGWRKKEEPGLAKKEETQRQETVGEPGKESVIRPEDEEPVLRENPAKAEAERQIMEAASDVRIRAREHQQTQGDDSVFWIRMKPLLENRRFAQFLLPDGITGIFIPQEDILPGRDAATGERLAAIFKDRRYSMMNMEKVDVVAADGTKAIAMFKLPGGAVVAHGSQQPERSGSKIFSRGNGAEDTRERKGTKERAR